MSTNYVITNGKIYTEKQVIENGYLVVEDGKISDIQQGTYTGELEQIDVKGQNVLPGFIDIHIHGGYGEDAMDASYDGLKLIIIRGNNNILSNDDDAIGR